MSKMSLLVTSRWAFMQHSIQSVSSQLLLGPFKGASLSLSQPHDPSRTLACLRSLQLPASTSEQSTQDATTSSAPLTRTTANTLKPSLFQPGPTKCDSARGDMSAIGCFQSRRQQVGCGSSVAFRLFHSSGPALHASGLCSMLDPRSPQALKEKVRPERD